MIVERLVALSTAAFGLVAALAWNEAIQSLFKEGGKLHFLSQGGVWIYALLVTVLAVIITIVISKAESKLKGGQQIN